MVSVLSCFGRAGVNLHVVFRFSKIGILEQALQNFDKLGTGGSQFFQMVQRECLEKLFAVASQLDEHLAAVVGAAQAAEQAALDQAIDQFYRAVMLRISSLDNLRTDSGYATFSSTVMCGNRA